MKETRSAAEEIKTVASAAAAVIKAAAEEAAKVLASASLANANNSALMGADITRIKEDIKEIKESQKEVAKNSVSSGDWNEHLKADADHEVRIRNVESWKNTLTGKMIGFGAAISIATAAVTLIINHFIK